MWPYYSERFAALVAADSRAVDHLSNNLRIVPLEFQEHGMPDLASIKGQAIFDTIELVDALRPRLIYQR